MCSIDQLESIYSNRDSDFHRITTENFHLYTQIVQALWNAWQTPGSTKQQIDILYHQLHRRSDIIVKKSFLVYTYQKMIYLEYLPYDPRFQQLISKKPGCTASGVNAFAILLSPFPDGQTFSCRHNCYYCPDFRIENGAPHDIARSYLPKEPAVARGLQNNWDPIKQIESRLHSLLMQGHLIDKLDIIIEGGTYTEYPKSYLLRFHRDIFYTANTFFHSHPKREPYALDAEMKINTKTKIKIIGICIETRPDAINQDWIRFFRFSGTTRIQLGVQHTQDSILKKINRGCNTQDAHNCIKLLKDQGFKVDIHLMPDLPFSSPQLDMQMFETVFNTPHLQPDQIKIYPCETTDFTVIKKWHDTGKYTHYPKEDLIKVIKHAVTLCKPWIRIQRIVRDIPVEYIHAGNTCMNLREVVDRIIKKEGKENLDIRCREIGRHKNYSLRDSRLFIRRYKASESWEYFISQESRDNAVVFGFIRLRIPPRNHNPVFPAILQTGLIRELHVYNNVVPVDTPKTFSTQHMGVGKKLLRTAEWIAWLWGLRGVSVISGEGVREYYKKLHYQDIQTYSIKYFTFTFPLIILLVVIHVLLLFQKLLHL